MEKYGTRVEMSSGKLHCAASQAPTSNWIAYLPIIPIVILDDGCRDRFKDNYTLALKRTVNTVRSLVQFSG